jgi:hypothetical protein
MSTAPGLKAQPSITVPASGKFFVPVKIFLIIPFSIINEPKKSEFSSTIQKFFRAIKFHSQSPAKLAKASLLFLLQRPFLGLLPCRLFFKNTA